VPWSVKNQVAKKHVRASSSANVNTSSLPMVHGSLLLQFLYELATMNYEQYLKFINYKQWKILPYNSNS
jgi:hypothetical protein